MSVPDVKVVSCPVRGRFYRLRVAPMVDVGLLLCSLVCIDQVGTSESRPKQTNVTPCPLRDVQSVKAKVGEDLIKKMGGS